LLDALDAEPEPLVAGRLLTEEVVVVRGLLVNPGKEGMA
jgi:hypothetical protein